MDWKTWMLFASLLLIFPVCTSAPKDCHEGDKSIVKLKGCKGKQHYVVADNFFAFINARKPWKQGQQIIPNAQQAKKSCVIFVKKNEIEKRKKDWLWPKMVINNGSHLLHISRSHIKRKLKLYVLEGKCSVTLSGLSDSKCVFNHTLTGSCQIRCVDTESICKNTKYSEEKCGTIKRKNRYIINTRATKENCVSCNNPVKKPEQLKYDGQNVFQGETPKAEGAAIFMKNMSNLVNSFSDSSADVVGVGKGVSGVFVKQEPEEVEEVSFAYGSPNDNINVIEGGDSLPQFSRSVTVPKEAFDKVVNANVTTPFAAVFRFLNMTSDEKNSTVLGNEVLAVEMGTGIANLTNKIRIRFCNIKYEGTPSCCSWNGEGSRPTWTHDGCRTNNSGENITCECSHLTFFAILLAPVNETISSNDLNTLTIITKVGCGISMFFLGLILFIHILIRKTKSRISTRILIHLVSAMFLLNLTFLTNSYVANMKSDVGCKIMAALMHYFMLATFTWFAVQAFHFSLQLYLGRGIAIRHYILKVCIISWLLPSVIAIVLISIGKYGEQQINSSDTKDTVAMCWITDNDVHYIVNIGYYALVFIFTLTAFITIVTWLCCLKRARNGTAQTSTNGKNMVNILGLCCILGVTWGFAFFANGVLRIPSYYIFTVLNSFQGFFLFIYYYKSSHSKEMTDGTSDQSSSNTSAIKTSVESLTNPYIIMSYNKRSPQITNGDQIVVKGSA